MTKLSNHQIKRLKAEAKKLAAAQKTKLSAAQDQIARRHGFDSFGLLIHSAQVQDSWPATNAGVHAAFSEYVDALDDVTLRYLVRHGGTVWVDIDDFTVGRLTADSFEALGVYMDGITRQVASNQNLVLALDLMGMAEAYYFGEEDEPFDSRDQQIYTSESARKWLLDISQQGGMVDSIEHAIEGIRAYE